MDELEDMLMEHGIIKPVDESIVGKTAAELAAEELASPQPTDQPNRSGSSSEGPEQLNRYHPF